MIKGGDSPNLLIHHTGCTLLNNLLPCFSDYSNNMKAILVTKLKKLEISIYMPNKSTGLNLHNNTIIN